MIFVTAYNVQWLKWPGIDESVLFPPHVLRIILYCISFRTPFPGSLSWAWCAVCEVFHGTHLNQYLPVCKAVEGIRVGERAVHVEQNSANLGRARKRTGERAGVNWSHGNKENREEDGVSDARIVTQADFMALNAAKIAMIRKNLAVCSCWVTDHKASISLQNIFQMLWLEVCKYDNSAHLLRTSY